MILIRADANKRIGTGHVMRCLSVAAAFREIGREVFFVTADHEGDALIRSRGFQTRCLNSDWTRMEGEDFGTVVELLHPELVLVDSYYVTETYFHKLRGLTRVAYIDDRNLSGYEVDCLINYNIFASAQFYPGYEETQLLLGPRYAPLRCEFRNLPEHSCREKVEDVLVTVGGADPDGVTERLIRDLCPGWGDIRFHFVVGALNPRLQTIEELAGQADNVVLHINERHMADLMQDCDLAISAAGTTLYELCACGIPTISFALADNQLLAAEEFGRRGIMMSAGDCRENDFSIQHLKSLLETLVTNRVERLRMSETMQTLVDGQGATRLVDALLGNL